LEVGRAEGVWGRKSPSGIQGQSTGGGLGVKEKEVLQQGPGGRAPMGSGVDSGQWTNAFA